MVRTYLGAVLLLGFVATFVVLPKAHAQAGGVDQVPKATSNLLCYEFDVKNDQEKRSIKDLHFGFPRSVTPTHMKAPEGWGWTAGANDSLSFETPPPNSTGTVSPHPIKPDEPALAGFRFCLEKETKEITISISYDEGANSPVKVFQGVAVESGFPVRRTSRLHCVKLKVTAPSETAVYDIHLRGVPSSTKPGFDDFALPKGWRVNGVREDAADIELDTPLEGGKSDAIGVCLRGKPDTIKWIFTDKQHKEIKGAEGKTKLEL